MDLSSKIEQRKAVVAVIGLGYAGLPLAVALAEAGFRVSGIDLDVSKVELVNNGESYIEDVPSARLHAVTTVRGGRQTSDDPDDRLSNGLLSATSDYDAIKESDAVIVCVPTPLGKTKTPDLSYIDAAANKISKHLHRGMIVVLESTTYPGTTEEVLLPRFQEGDRKFEVGKDFYLAFSPERINPGSKLWNVRNTPKVMGGVTPICLEMASHLYETIVDEVVPVSSPREAEMVKLLENTFRATNIALVNELAMICNRLGVNVWEVIEAAKTKPFGFMPFYPGPGLGGHCIPIDPQYLAWKLRTLDYNARFVQLAEEVNLGMPPYVVEMVSDGLNEAGRPLKGSRILVLGVAYKADVADYRESPALDVIDLLIRKGGAVQYHDPHVPAVDMDTLTLSSIELDEAALRDSDCVVITTAHRSYDWDWVVENSSLIIDTRNAIENVSENNCRIVKL